MVKEKIDFQLKQIINCSGGQRNEQEEKMSMETENAQQEPERKTMSEESSVISDHSDNGQTEEVNGIKSRNLHGRLLSSNSRKQKHPMRRYSGSGEYRA